MGRFLIFVGISLIVVAVIFMLVGLGVAGEEVAGQIIIPLACEEGDSIRTESRMTFSSDGRSQTTDFFCVDSEGIEENVTDSVIVIIIVGFGGLLITGILTIFMGSRIVSKRMQENLRNTVFEQQGIGNIHSSVIDLRSNTLKQGQIPPETQAQIQAIFSQMGDAFANNDSLADKLQQLEEARQQGLISQAEYERTRQAILDSMDD